MPVLFDKINENAFSGTELTMRKVNELLDPVLSEKVAIARDIKLLENDSRPRIYWVHGIPGDTPANPAIENRTIRDPATRWNYIDRIVFVSEWQQAQYAKQYKLTPKELKERTCVIRNAIHPIEAHTKPSGKIKLIYTSVPVRGLNVLYQVFSEIADRYPNVELDVYSSFNIYGIPHMDKRFERLFDALRAHPQINYYGTVSNSELREALKQSHIFAYPSTFMETSCVALIEAMSAGLLCVHSSIAGLPETAAGHTNMYEWCTSPTHEKRFAEHLERAIKQYINGNLSGIPAQQQYINDNYSWDVRMEEWNNFIKEII